LRRLVPALQGGTSSEVILALEPTVEVARPPRSRAGPVRSAHGLCPSIRRRASCCSPAGRGQLVAPVLAPPTAVQHAPLLRHALPPQCTRLCSSTRLRPAHNWPGSTR